MTCGCATGMFHGDSLHPRHRPDSQRWGRPCSVQGVSAMFPDSGVTYVYGLYLGGG